MKSVELLSSNLPRVIDWSNLSPSHFDRLMTLGILLDNNPTLFIFISILMMTQGTQKTGDREIN